MANNVHISGSGHIQSGEYSEIHISGSGNWQGPVQCESFHISGSGHGEGTLTVLEDLHCSGSLRNEGHVDCKELSVSGSARVEGNVAGREEVHVSGSLRCRNLYGGEVSISGGINAEGDVEAEEFHLSGGGEIKGLLNAEEIDIVVGAFTIGRLRIGQIGGSEIVIRRTQTAGLLGKILGSGKNGTAVVEVGVIEGDEIELACTKAEIVRGTNITLKSGCQIDRVEYSGELEIEDGVVVGEQVRI